jgi:choline/glycine/proline betaine transport protein
LWCFFKIIWEYYINIEEKESFQKKKLKFDIHPVVFFTSAGLIIGFVIFSIFFNEILGDIFNPLLNSITTNAGWFFTFTVNVILLFVLYLMFSRYGEIRLGGDDAEPDFSTTSWFAMLFSAGMGIGLLFYGVAEPMFHFINPPIPVASQTEAAHQAMAFTFLHWGLHSWSIYALIGLALAFFSFNKGLPLSIRTIFYPLLGERINGGWGNLIDILATISTLFGVATSLGFGVQQINAGLSHLFGIEQTIGVQIVLIVVITTIATISVVKGLDSGIRKLSEINIRLAMLLLAFVFIC